MESFTDRLKQAIDRSGYKAKDIASAAGISPQHLSNYCRGTANPKKNMIKQTCRRAGRRSAVAADGHQ
jgi:transcriptional regulator with XRE-family HTH domain